MTRPSSWALLGAVALVLAIAACGARRVATVSAGSSSPRGAKSNIEAADYAGSQACTPCHADIAKSFAASPMHGMTRMADTATIQAPFAGETLWLGDDKATLERRGDARFVRIDRLGAQPALYRVTRVLGGHHREDFVGVRVAGADEAPSPRVGDADELVLPLSYLIEKKRLRYKGYSVMVHERSRIEPGPVWNQTCPFCHNTVPLLSTMLGVFASPRAPHFQGEVVDALLPQDRAFRYDVRDEAGLDAAAGRELFRLGERGESGRRPVVRALEATRGHFTGSKLLEVGIGCESCHGGCREHVVDPSVAPSLLPVAPYLAVRSPGNEGPPTRAETENHVCARCHQVLFSRYPWTWEGGRRDASPGGSHINSGEARDLLLGGCKGALACTACHDPHAADDTAHLAALSTPSGNEVCLPCHASLRAKPALAAHAHHDPDGVGGVCIACHMARKNMSLSGGLTRYHRIGSPTDPMRVLLDRPLECALCHADKTVAALVGTMAAWWNKAYDREILTKSYGDLGTNALRATLERGKPHEKAVALSILGSVRDRESARLIAAELDDPYPLLRDFAVEALRSTFGPACDLSLTAEPAEREAERQQCAKVAGISLSGPASNRIAVPARDEPAED